MKNDPNSVVRNVYAAFVDKNRDAIEKLIGDTFHFTSPLDNQIDRDSYFKRCWPNSETIKEFKFIHFVVSAELVFVTYEGKSTDGQLFRNTEILRVENNKLVEVEVYFGWNIPHEAADGKSVKSKSE